jgi:hypothetical protein
MNRIESIDNTLKSFKSLSYDDLLTKLKAAPLMMEAPETIEESITRFSRSAEAAVKLTEEGGILSLPMNILNAVSESSEQVKNAIENLAEGGSRDNFTNSVIKFEEAVWRTNRLATHSSEWEKVAQEERLKTLEERLLIDAETLSQVSDLLSNLENKFEEVSKEFEVIEAEKVIALQAKNDALAAAKEATLAATKSATQLQTLEEAERKSAEALGRAQTSESGIQSFKTEIENFFKEIQNYRIEISRTTATSDKAIKETDEKIASLLSELQKSSDIVLQTLREQNLSLLEDSKKQQADVLELGRAEHLDLMSNLRDLKTKAEEQLHTTTAGALSHKFDNRGKDLATAKDVWVTRIQWLIVVAIGWGAFIALSHSQADAQFYLKLTISIPIAYGIAFCTSHYSRDRRLEEEYAFKSSVSLSLESYRILLEKIIREEDAKEREEYTKFVLKTIGQIFSSPTAAVYGDRQSRSARTGMKEFRLILKELLKPVEPALSVIDKLKGK